MKITRCSIDRSNSYQAWNIVWTGVIKPSSTFHIPPLHTTLLQFGLAFQRAEFRRVSFSCSTVLPVQVSPSKLETLPTPCPGRRGHASGESRERSHQHASFNEDNFGGAARRRDLTRSPSRSDSSRVRFSCTCIRRTREERGFLRLSFSLLA